MSDVGFWRIAASDPEHVALVAPDGRSVRAGALLARTNQLVHGLRRRG
jgi:long-chain acyl-CoA synthetase